MPFSATPAVVSFDRGSILEFWKLINTPKFDPATLNKEKLYGAVKIQNPKDGLTFKVNGQRSKPFYEGVSAGIRTGHMVDQLPSIPSTYMIA
ncbi:unnamed protein product [Prunus armeniaca]